MKSNQVGIGQFIRLKRLKKGMSIRQVALYAGCSDSYLSLLERGKQVPSPKFLQKLTKPLEVPYEVLLEIAGYPVHFWVVENSAALVQRLCFRLECSSDQLAQRLGLSAEELSFMSRNGLTPDMILKLMENMLSVRRSLSPARTALLEELEGEFRQSTRRAERLESLLQNILSW